MRVDDPGDLGDAPCLSEAAARGVRRVAVENLRDRSEPRFADVRAQWSEPEAHGAPRLLRVSEHPEVRVGERAEQPGPDGPLMVGEVALPLRAGASGPVARVLRVEGAQTEGGQETPPDGPVHGAAPVRRKEVLRQRDGEDLVRTQRRVDSVLSDDVVEAFLVRIPEDFVEPAGHVPRLGLELARFRRLLREPFEARGASAVSYTHLRAHETP